MSKDIRIQLALDNWDEYVDTLTKLSDKVLVKKIDLIDIQSQLAFKTKNESSSQLLLIWWKQTVEARILKAENNIPDALNEIEITIADIETVVAKAEEREEVFKEHTQPEKAHRLKIQEDNSNQISLF